jgi:DNA repair protein RadC
MAPPWHWEPMMIGTTAQAMALLGPLFASAPFEQVAVLHLGEDKQLIALTIEGAGSRGEVELPVASILRNALRLGSCAIVVAHNHPSGNPTPSAADEAATRSLASAAAGVDIRLHDHLIFAGSGCRSFRSLGLL